MEKIIKYLNKYGNSSFNEVPFNNLDRLVLSLISYINFNEIILDSKRYKISYLRDRFFDMYSDKKLKNYITGTKSAIKFFRRINDYKRFSELEIYNYKNIISVEEQFSAFTVDVDDVNTIIVFEGTDDLVSGWLEDCELSFMFPIPAQKDAIKYVNNTIPYLTSKKYHLVGHSKGGNLALVSGMYTSIFVRNKIISITSLDGPGFINESFLSKRKYKRIEPIYNHIIPEFSIIGLLLYHKNNYKVVKCNKKGLEGHDLVNWEVNDTDFVYSNLSSSSINFQHQMSDWLENLSMEERELFIKSLFSVFELAGITDLSQIKEDLLPNISNIIKGIKNTDNKYKKMLRELIILIINSSK